MPLRPAIVAVGVDVRVVAAGIAAGVALVVVGWIEARDSRGARRRENDEGATMAETCRPW